MSDPPDEEQRLIARIVDAPDDDAPRLVYADWLIERDDPRGELVQLQVKLAAEPDDARRRAIRVAENKLLKAHAKTWTVPLEALLPKAQWLEQYKFAWSRGFVERAKITVNCLPLLGALLERAPLLRALELHPSNEAVMAARVQQPKLGDALAAPELARFVELECELPGAGDELAAAIARAASLANLTALRVRASVWGEAAAYMDAPAERVLLTAKGASALAASPHLARVKHLKLDSNRIGIEGARAIANGAWRLETLDLAHNGIDDDGVVEALVGPATANLVALRLAGNALAKRDIELLAKGAAWPHLVDLDLESCNLGAAGTAAFCAAFAMPALRRLRLERNSLGDAGGIAVANCAAFAQLTDFEAGHNRMGAKAGAALATSPHLAHLERLLLNEPRWKPELTEAFAASKTLAATKIYLKGKLLKKTK